MIDEVVRHATRLSLRMPMLDDRSEPSRILLVPYHSFRPSRPVLPVPAPFLKNIYRSTRAPEPMGVSAVPVFACISRTVSTIGSQTDTRAQSQCARHQLTRSLSFSSDG